MPFKVLDLRAALDLVDGLSCPRNEVFVSPSNNSMELSLRLLWYFELSKLTPFSLLRRGGLFRLRLLSEYYRRSFLRRHC